MRITHNKLVRDNIPQIIEADGHSYAVRTLDENAYVDALKMKLIEEAKEVEMAGSTEELTTELADALEVIISLCEVTGIPFASVTRARENRAETRGRFTQRIFLEYVDTISFR